MPKWNYYKTNSLLVCAQERDKTLETLSCPGHYPFPPSLKNHYPESSHFLAFLYSCLHPLDTIVQSCLLKKKIICICLSFPSMCLFRDLDFLGCRISYHLDFVNWLFIIQFLCISCILTGESRDLICFRFDPFGKIIHGVVIFHLIVSLFVVLATLNS